VLVGAAAYRSLPSRISEIAPPTIESAPAIRPSAEVVSTVATPLEQEINGVEDMLYVSSQAPETAIW